MRDSLKKSELWSAMILLVLHMAVFPIALSLLMAAKPDLLGASQMNFIYYALSLLLVALFLGKFLRRSFDGLVDAPGRCLTSFALGWVAYIALGMIATYALKELSINTDNLNEQTISTMLSADRGIIIAMTVFLAPIVEESIFRGGIFCGLHQKSRVAAYAASIVMFCRVSTRFSRPGSGLPPGKSSSVRRPTITAAPIVSARKRRRSAGITSGCVPLAPMPQSA